MFNFINNYLLKFRLNEMNEVYINLTNNWSFESR